MYILKDGACGVARPRFRGVRKIQDSGIYRRVRLAAESGYGCCVGPFGAYRMERACRKEYTGVRKGYRGNEYDKNNACIK